MICNAERQQFSWGPATKMTDYDTDKQGRGFIPAFNKTMRQSCKAEKQRSKLGKFFPFFLFCDFQSGNFGDREDLKLDMF